MVLTEKIQKYIQRLPESLQAEVLDYIEYLLAKTELEMGRQEEKAWSAFSLLTAMRGMDDEDAPVYEDSDLKVTFS